MQRSVTNVQRLETNMQRSVTNVQRSVTNVQRSVTNVQRSVTNLQRSVTNLEVGDQLAEVGRRRPSTRGRCSLSSSESFSFSTEHPRSAELSPALGAFPTRSHGDPPRCAARSAVPTRLAGLQDWRCADSRGRKTNCGRRFPDLPIGPRPNGLDHAHWLRHAACQGMAGKADPPVRPRVADPTVGGIRRIRERVGRESKEPKEDEHDGRAKRGGQGPGSA